MPLVRFSALAVLIFISGGILPPITDAQPGSPVEYLIISPQGHSWQRALEPLVSLHEARGVLTGVHPIEIPTTTEFVRSLIRAEYERGSGLLRYVLLAGDANDHEHPAYWDCPCEPQNDLIPMSEYATKDTMVETGFSRWSHYIPNDWLYVDFNEDSYPDIAIGRLPVRSPAELTRAVQKTLLAAERMQTGSEYLSHIGVWSQDQDGNGNVGDAIHFFIDEIVAIMPDQLIIDRLDKSVLKTYENGEAAAIEALREGRGIVLSMGTASATHNWNGFLDTKRGFDWSNWRLLMADSPPLPFALSVSADLANVDQTETIWAPHLGEGRPLMEEAFLSPHTGPWGVFAPTRGSWGYPSMMAIQLFLKFAYEYGTPSAGWAACSTIGILAKRFPRYRDYIRSLIFLGDPALTLPGQVISTVDVPVRPATPGGPFVRIAGANPARSRVVIEYGLTSPARVRLSTFDIRGRHRANLVDAERKPGSYRHEWNPGDGQGMSLRAGVYFIHLSINGFNQGTTKFVWTP
jgi:hypothetical protein